MLFVFIISNVGISLCLSFTKSRDSKLKKQSCPVYLKMRYVYLFSLNAARDKKIFTSVLGLAITLDLHTSADWSVRRLCSLMVENVEMRQVNVRHVM